MNMNNTVEKKNKFKKFSCFFVFFIVASRASYVLKLGDDGYQAGKQIGHIELRPEVETMTNLTII